jgi:hypothetical protein
MNARLAHTKTHLYVYIQILWVFPGHFKYASIQIHPEYGHKSTQPQPLINPDPFHWFVRCSAAYVGIFGGESLGARSLPIKMEKETTTTIGTSSLRIAWAQQT